MSAMIDAGRLHAGAGQNAARNSPGGLSSAKWYRELNMTNRKVAILCVVALAFATGAVLIVRNPSFWVHEGMTVDEVEAVLGKPEHGLRPTSMYDGSWTGIWMGPYGLIEVTFDSQDRVRESPNLARRAMRWLGL